MLTLAIDTASDRGSVALGEQGDVRCCRTFSDRTHASKTIPSILEMLSEIGAATSDVRRIVVGDGPGSFTGVRIGFATAFGYRNAKPDVDLLAVPSLAGLALGASYSCDGPVAALFDAMRGEVFAAIYEFGDGSATEILKPSLALLEDLATGYPDVCGAAGEAAEQFEETVRRWTGQAPVRIEDSVTVANHLIEWLELGYPARKILDAMDFVPDYGRLPAAQDKWERANKTELPGQVG